MAVYRSNSALERTEDGLILSAFIHNLDAGNEFKHGGIRPEFKFKASKSPLNNNNKNNPLKV